MKWHEHKQAMVIVAAGLLAAGFAMFGFVPIAWHKFVISQTLQRQRVTLEQIRHADSQIAALEQLTARMERDAADFDRKVPAERQFADLWGQIAEMMNRHQLDNQVVRPGDETENQNINQVILDIECQGTLNDIFAFIQDIEQMERLVRLEQLELQNDADFSGRVKLVAKALVFYQPAASAKSKDLS